MQEMKNIIAMLYPDEEFSENDLNQMAYDALRFFRICLGYESDYIS